MRTTTPRVFVFSRYWRLRRRPNSLPLDWRPVASTQGTTRYTRFRDWLLVLNACGIPHQTIQLNGREYIYVPALLENIALNELGAFVQESLTPAPQAPSLPVHPHAFVAALALLPVILWHGWRMGWWHAPLWLPSPDLWNTAGVLDGVRVRVFNEWYRTVTALTLHASLTHLCGNVAFGSLFLILLARLTGIGRALWLTLLGGALGNALTALLRPRPVLSLGFSTALFASIGAISGYMACQQQGKRKAMLPVAAAAALLAMLGTEGENTDYAAHLAGLGCGLALGAFEGWRARNNRARLGQWVSGAAAALLVAGAWWWAFAAISN